MSSDKDYYALLGVPRNATPDELRRAYRESALRLHPDRNVAAGETELFLEVNLAYETLIDPERRKAYDEDLKEAEIAMAADSAFQCSVTHGKKNLLQLDEPQVHYLLLEITASAHLPESRPPINIAVIVDHSTSMRGQRLDQIRSATLSILKNLDPNDSVSVIGFGDRAEVVLSPDQAKDMKVARARMSLLQAGGGTEIAQGLETGLATLQNNFQKDGVNLMMLLTDGRTYGDEDLCVALADKASADGIMINCIGIGSDWSDRLLDDIASRSGGTVVFMNSPRAIQDLLEGIYSSLSRVVANHVQIIGAVGQQVDVRSVFRIEPEPMPLGDSLPLNLGHLLRDSSIRILIEAVIHPVRESDKITLAHFNITGEILKAGKERTNLPLEITIPVTDQPDIDPPPEEIVSATNYYALYRMQEKARHEAELGQSTQAARRLENLAMNLIESGEKDLAKAALSEAQHLIRSHRISSEGEKILKYGTRALMLPSPRTDAT